MSIFSLKFNVAPGDCSPSRNVVSKRKRRSLPASATASFEKARRTMFLATMIERLLPVCNILIARVDQFEIGMLGCRLAKQSTELRVAVKLRNCYTFLRPSPDWDAKSARTSWEDQSADPSKLGRKSLHFGSR
ncbi:hypothetical protein PsorP6_003885 [Peronosclerospora sorghi]|uniref:Uncharacterized protein n=1 Tax=Peronosclerospora sorghi TaxID=230839 RepID=A0ACC0VQL7_9STRA|nr:hypothetical protein PsorP6_003885 [Peronosclerospora sorghi]